MKKIFLFCIFLLLANNIFACTSWSTLNGENNTVLLAKNRDELPYQRQAVILKKPSHGYVYLALVSINDNNPGIRAGINQAGLAVMSLSASAMEKAQRRGRGGAIKKMLTHCASISDVIKQQNFLFAGQKPDFYMLADPHQIAYVEVGPQGQFNIAVRNRGDLYHTNHYLSPRFSTSNEKAVESSHVRYQRIAAIMQAHQNRPWSFTNFIAVSRDQTAGPNNSIWRVGTGGVRTLSTFVVSIPKNNSPPTVYIYLATPGQMGKKIQINLTPQIWHFAGTEKVLLQ